LRVSEAAVSLGLAGLAAILLCAGPAKAAVPRPAASGLTGVLGSALPVTPSFIRVFAVSEIAVAALLMWATTRAVGLTAAAAFGVAFVGLGVVGVARGGREPCGCFGRATGRPIGWVNVVLGALILAASVVLLRIPGSVHPAAPQTLLATTAVFTVIAAMWLYRDLLLSVARSQGLIRR
jgi:hypothetical protein